MDVLDEIKQTINENPVVLFLKGTPDFPQCGFSMKAAEALRACNAKFTYVDVLAAPEIRANLPTYSNWPTFPQLFIRGELIGGCDIVVDLYQKGELEKLLSSAGACQRIL